MKHFFNTIFLLAVILLSSKVAAHDFKVDGIYYRINGTNVSVTYRGSSPDLYTDWYSGNVIIPATINYNGFTYSVTSIDNNAFCECSRLTSITIPNSVSSIGDNAFCGCSGLTSITIPNYVSMIGDYAFERCRGLTIIEIPNSVTSIGDYAFYECNGLTSITISNSVTSIGNYTFCGCNGLTSITIPNSVTSIGDYAFYECNGLSSITIPNTVSSIGLGAFYGTAWFDNQQDGLIYAGLVVYKYKGTMPDGTSIVLREGTLGITHGAFNGCTGLTSITIPNSVTTIGSSAFYGCSTLMNINIPSCVTSIGSGTFYNCSSLMDIEIPNSVTSIGSDAFYGCSSLTNIEIPNSVTTIGSSAFYGCSTLTNINIPSCVTSIGGSTFRYCSSLTEILIPNSVTTIGNYAFQGCSSLTSVTLSDSIASIGTKAFYDCPNLTKVMSMNGTPPSCGDLQTFNNNVYNHANLYVPKESKSKYIASANWGQFINIIGINTSTDVFANSVKLNHNLVNIEIGGTTQLVATVLPDSTTNKVVSWTTSDDDVAIVDSIGFVTAIATGTATITATTTDGSNLSASCTVYVYDDLSQFDNYLSIEDVEAFHGDTIVIPVKMTNEASIISFQADIFLPEGLELLQEDGEYMIDPSPRMTRTHSIMSNDVSNGAIRVVCYSSNYKPFTGNSGDDLFYLTVKVADDTEGDYIIQLKNTLLTNTDFVDLPAPDVAANVNVKSYVLGDANNSGTVTVTDVVVTAQYILELNPQPFIFEAADVNFDNNITVADVSRIAWMVLNPTLNAPLRAPALWNTFDRMSGEGITLATGETRRVSIILDNEMDYSAFQLDLHLPEGLTASNFQLTDRAGNHAFDVNTLQNGNIRALCYSPALDGISGHEGALLTFDVTATGTVTGDITVESIEMVTTACQTVNLDGFTIAVNHATAVNELATGKTVAKVEYFNLAGQQMEQPSNGMTLVVTTYTDGTRSTTKVIR